MIDRTRFEADALPHLRELFGTACRLARNQDDAQDLVQETFLRAYRGFRNFEPGTNIRAWLYSILHRVHTDGFRKASRSIRTGGPIENEPAVPPQQAALAQGGELIWRAVAELPDPFRTAVLLRDVQDFSYEEIAGITGVPLGTVMSRIHRGRTMLRKRLEEKHS